MTVAIDGKTIRHSYSAEQKAGHVVTAFASRMQLVLGQVKTDEKSNGITAIPELLELFQVKDTVITIDAMRTQKDKDIAATIIEKGGDYVLAVKGKSEEPARQYRLASAQRTPRHKHKRAQSQGQYASTLEKDHGRTRKENVSSPTTRAGSKTLKISEASREWRGSIIPVTSLTRIAGSTRLTLKTITSFTV